MDEFFGRLEPVFGAFCEHPQDGSLEQAWDGELEFGWLDWVGGADFGDGVGQIRALVWRSAGQQGIGGRAEAVDIGSRVDRGVFDCALGRHIGDGADELAWSRHLSGHDAFERLREHQVSQLGDIALFLNQDVFWCDISMNDLLRVGRFERPRDMHGHIEGVAPIEHADGADALDDLG